MNNPGLDPSIRVLYEDDTFEDCGIMLNGKTLTNPGLVFSATVTRPAP